MSTNDNLKTYSIKIPVYTSEPITKPNDVFGGVTYKDMINHVVNKIAEYDNIPFKLSRNKRNKTQKKEVDKIEYNICSLGGIEAILLRISAYNTNLYDGYIETDERFSLEKNHKIGSNNNFVLLYPNIYGLDNNNYMYHWIVLIYEDPNKNDGLDLVSTAKMVLNKVLGISIANIKLPEVMNEIEKIKTIPEIQLKFTSLKFEDNEVSIKYRDYLSNSCVKAQKMNTFKNMPFERIEEIIEDNTFQAEYQTKEIKIIAGNKEYKIIDKLEEAKEIFKKSAEQIFNATASITELDLENKIYEKDFILSKLEPILNNYLNSSELNG